VFEELQAAGVEADGITYSAMISACEKGRQVDKAGGSSSLRGR
jgi:pentatricopeptide repeat domain-containing protein 1